MFSEVGFEGIFSVEFLVDNNGELWFLEINFRNSTWSYAATKAGMNLVYGWLLAMEGTNLPQQKRIREGFTAMAEFDDFFVRIKAGENFFTWLKEFTKCECKYCYSSSDVMPFFSTLCYRVLMWPYRKIKRKLGFDTERTAK